MNMVRKIKKLFFAGWLLCAVIPLPAQQRTISADLDKEAGLRKKVYNECVGAGRASEGLRADWQEHLRLVQQKCNFRYIRFHGLLNDEMGVCSVRDGKIIYNFHYIDVLYDFLLSAGIKPFVELSFMPTPLKSGDHTVMWWKGNTSPPADWAEYERMISLLTKHFTERYGEEEVKTWYFEVWNEPNLKDFFSGTEEEYHKMYATAAKAIKAVHPAYRVGGPASAGSPWVPGFIHYCQTNHVPVDFVSSHNYGVEGNLDEFGAYQLFMGRNFQWITNDVAYIRQLIEESGKPLELHYTEWNTSYSFNDPVHDTYQQAPYMLYVLKNTEKTANSMSFWTFTDIFEEGGPPPTAFHGGFGMLNEHGIKKPAFHVYDFLNRLGETEVQNADTASWICKSKDGSVQILAWDFELLQQGKKSNQVFYRQLLPSENKGKLKISLKNVEQGTYFCDISSVGFEKGDVFSAYYKIGLPVELNQTQESYLKSIGDHVKYKTDIITIGADGKFETTLPLSTNDIYLIELKKVN
jgi:xylan 1,4-beta-xylosidase